jgi:ATP-dependent protease ClpP protease subunit
MGLGVELFRLDAVEEEELTAEELEVAEEEKPTAIMRVYEEIGEDFWTGGGVTAKKFAEELDSFGEIKKLNIHINSLGGDVFTAQAIHSIIKDHKSNKTSYIDGVAASAATLIACGADKVVARYNANYMIHNPWAMAIGNADVMRKAADDLDAITKPIVNVYLKQVQGKVDEDKIRKLMDDETWMTADEALEFGFIDRIRGKIKAIARFDKTKILCSGRLMDIAKYHYRNVPKYPQAEEATEPERKEQTKMTSTREEIDPQLLSTIQDEARVAERARLAALDAMDGPGLSEIITKAKSEGKQPADIAMECFNATREQLTTANTVNALARDAKPAGDVPASSAPHRKPEDTRKTRVEGLIKNAFDAQRNKPVVARSNNHEN